jgi:hypothetical protein
MVIGLPAIVAGSGLALVAWQASQAGASHPTASPVPTKQPISGGVTSIPIGRKATMMANVGQLVTVGGKGQTSVASPSRTPSPLVSGGTSAELAIRQKLHELEAAAKSEYDKLTAEAKRRAAEALNKMSPSPGLTGNETFAEAAQKVGAAVGSIVGVAACNALPIPGVATVVAHTACATLGAIIGAYLGGKLGEWATKLYGEVQAWADKAWEGVKDTAGDAGGAIEEAASDAWNGVKNLF